MRPIQKVHRHPMVGEQKPDMMGAKSGPKTVAWLRCVALVSDCRDGSDTIIGLPNEKELTAKKDAMARPLVRYSP